MIKSFFKKDWVVIFAVSFLLLPTVASLGLTFMYLNAGNHAIPEDLLLGLRTARVQCQSGKEVAYHRGVKLTLVNDVGNYIPCK